MCVLTAAAPFFHRSLLTPINVLHMTALQYKAFHRPELYFCSVAKRGIQLSAESLYMDRISHESCFLPRLK